MSCRTLLKFKDKLHGSGSIATWSVVLFGQLMLIHDLRDFLDRREQEIRRRKRARKREWQEVQG